MVWWTKKPAHAEIPPPIASLQEHNNLPPGESIAQSDALPALNKTHASRSEALQAIGLPDVAPPPGNGVITRIDPPPVKAPPLPKPPDSLADQMQALQDANTLAKHALALEADYEQHAANLNNAGQISAALSPQRSYAGKCGEHSDDEIMQLLERGYLQAEIARMWNVAPSTLCEYIQASSERSARAQVAKRMAGEAMDAKAYELIVTAPPGQEMKRRELATHLRWRASKLAPDYQDKQRLTVDGGLTIQHEAPERPAIADMVQAALQAVTPKPKVIDIEPDD